MLYFVFIILLAVLLPLAEGFLLAFWIKQNESELLASLGWTPEAIVEDEKRLKNGLESAETIGKDQLPENNVESKVNTDEAAEFVSNLLENDESESGMGAENFAESYQDGTGSLSEDFVEETEKPEIETTNESQIEIPETSDSTESDNAETFGEENIAESFGEQSFDETPEEPVDPSQAGFENPEQLFQSLAEGGVEVGQAVEEMFSDEQPTISSDLEQRIEENENLEDKLAQFEREQDENDEGFSEEDILNEAKTNDHWENEPPVFQDEFAERQDETEGISSMARELLGENFDFDAFDEHQPGGQGQTFESTENPENGNSEPNDLEQSSGEPMVLEPERKISETAEKVAAEPMTGDVFQSFGGMEQIVDSPMFADWNANQNVLPVFPTELIQDMLIEPDDSEAAKRNSFVEESKPMFDRRKKTF